MMIINAFVAMSLASKTEFFTWGRFAFAGIIILVAAIGYNFLYQYSLRRLSPQNILLSGLAASLLPMLACFLVTDSINTSSLVLSLIIFTWIPGHCWSRAIADFPQYRTRTTRQHIIIYTLLMITVTYTPVVVAIGGLIYLLGASLLNIGFLVCVTRLYQFQRIKYAVRTFHYSVFYLMALFLVLLIDHFYPLMK